MSNDGRDPLGPLLDAILFTVFDGVRLGFEGIAQRWSVRPLTFTKEDLVAVINDIAQRSPTLTITEEDLVAAMAEMRARAEVLEVEILDGAGNVIGTTTATPGTRSR